MSLATLSTNDCETIAGRVLVVDDRASARDSMADILRHAGHEVDTSASAREALAKLDSSAFDVVLTDLNMPGMSGLEFIKTLGERQVESQVIMVTAYASINSAVEAMRHGAFDYIEKPLNATQLEKIVGRALRQVETLVAKTSISSASSSGASVAMIGSSNAMQQLQRRINQVGPTDVAVLITGENGTGKELVARSVHGASRRASREMISVNCPVLSAHLMESELFGHERGAFTSADAPRVGRFELADGGTIHLDEITEIDLKLQAKLLRVLQEKTFERVGASQSVKADVRVLATTNRVLRDEVAAGRFREDLYFRLAVVELEVPPLRKRREDIPQLITHFQCRAAQRLGSEPTQFDDGALELLAAYHWPGNVRELENIVTRACVFGGGKQISADDLRPWLIDGDALRDSETTESPGVNVSINTMERKLIESTLEHFGGHRQRTAAALGIGVRTLSGKLRAYGLAPRAKTFSTSDIQSVHEKKAA
jgi:DNA-binding NtrC family response regulator